MSPWIPAHEHTADLRAKRRLARLSPANRVCRACRKRKQSTGWFHFTAVGAYLVMCRPCEEELRGLGLEKAEAVWKFVDDGKRRAKRDPEPSGLGAKFIDALVPVDADSVGADGDSGDSRGGVSEAFPQADGDVVSNVLGDRECEASGAQVKGPIGVGVGSHDETLAVVHDVGVIRADAARRSAVAVEIGKHHLAEQAWRGVLACSCGEWERPWSGWGPGSTQVEHMIRGAHTVHVADELAAVGHLRAAYASTETGA
ncbi:hypothetical protein K0651_01990 [Ornithinimicrobium sp. Arc0846-15]|nr:hypothetical protein [Ornithinimicrobium laminariae]